MYSIYLHEKNFLIARVLFDLEVESTRNLD
jgi:hypothetical protein